MKQRLNVTWYLRWLCCILDKTNTSTPDFSTSGTNFGDSVRKWKPQREANAFRFRTSQSTDAYITRCHGKYTHTQQNCLFVFFFSLDVNPYGSTNDPCILCMFQTTDTTAGMGQARSLDFPGGGVIKLENTDSTIGSFPSSTTPTSTATSKTIPVSQDNKTSLW